MVWYGIALLFILLLLLPVKVKINYHKNNPYVQEGSKNDIVVYLLYFIPIVKVDLDKKENQKKYTKKMTKNKENESNQKITNQKQKNSQHHEKKDISKMIKLIKILHQNLYIDKLEFHIGFNTNDAVLNAYLMALSNAIINMYIAKNISKIKINRVNYTTYISNFNISFDVTSIIKFRFANTIFDLMKNHLVRER